MKLFEKFKFVFNSKNQQKTKEEKKLYVGNYVILEMNNNILSQLREKNSSRYDPAIFNSGIVKGIVKAIYVDDLGNQYAEILSVSEPGKHKEYPVYFHEITKIISSIN